MDSRDKVLEMVEEGLISADQALLMCLKWMSQDDVDGMMDMNELNENESYSEKCDKLDNGTYYSYDEK